MNVESVSYNVTNGDTIELRNSVEHVAISASSMGRAVSVAIHGVDTAPNDGRVGSTIYKVHVFSVANGTPFDLPQGAEYVEICHAQRFQAYVVALEVV